MPRIAVKDYWEVHVLPRSIELDISERELAALQNPATKDDLLRNLVRRHNEGRCVSYSHLDEGNFEVL